MGFTIAVDATGFGRHKTGTAVYALEILRVWNADKNLTARFHIFISPKTRPYFEELNLDSRFCFHFAPDDRGLRSIWQHLVLPFKVSRLACDVLWGTSFIVPLLALRPCVVTIHDMTFCTLPAVHERMRRWYFGTVVGSSIAKARVILCVSETTRNDVARLYPSAGEKLKVTLLGPRVFSGKILGSLEQGAEKPPYVLAIGTLEPRKNLPRLLRAWHALAPSVRGDTRLYVAGSDGWMMGDLKEQRSTDDSSVEFLGHVEEGRLWGLLQGALFLAYPSLYEGFGLPVIEAMSLGVPVLTSGVGATAEVAGGSACLVDPMDEDSIAAGLARLLLSGALRERLIVAGRERARSFSWQRTADLTFRALKAAHSPLVIRSVDQDP